MFNLIHMNGRIYDPEIARFLSPDPIIQDSYNILNYNRYSYCLNNPLKFSDPSGFIIAALPRAVEFVNPQWGDFCKVRSSYNVNLASSSGSTIEDSRKKWEEKAKEERNNTSNNGENKEKNPINLKQTADGIILFGFGLISMTAGFIAGFAEVPAPVVIGTTITFGAVSMGLGAGMFATGLGGGNGDEIPSGIFEAFDVATGGDGTLGQLFDIATNGVPKNTSEFLYIIYEIANTNLFKDTGYEYQPPSLDINFRNLSLPADNTKVINNH